MHNTTMHKTTSNRHALQLNSVNSRVSTTSEGRFHKRPCGLERFIPLAGPRETYMVIRTWMHPQSRTCVPGIEDIAERAGVSPRTIQRHARYLKRIGVLIVRERRIGHRSHATHVYTFPLLNEDFLRSRVSPVGCQIVTVKQVPEIKQHTTTPRAPEARRWTQDREPAKRPETPPFTRWREWRERCERRRLRMRSEARIGTYDPSEAPAPATAVEMAKVEAELEAWAKQARERREENQREEDRKRQERLAYVERRRFEAAEPPDAELQAKIDALKQKFGMTR